MIIFKLLSFSSLRKNMQLSSFFLNLSNARWCFWGSHKTPGDGTLQITSNIRLFETCCSVWHSSLRFVNDVQGIHSVLGSVYESPLQACAAQRLTSNFTTYRTSLFLVLNKTCYKKAEVHQINQFVWLAVTEKKPGKCELWEMLQLRVKPGEVFLHALVIQLQPEIHSLCCVGFANQLCVTLRVFQGLWPNSVTQQRFPVSLVSPSSAAPSPAAQFMGLSKALHF